VVTNEFGVVLTLPDCRARRKSGIAIEINDWPCAVRAAYYPELRATERVRAQVEFSNRINLAK
jgi:hypothetical protein